MLRPKMRMMRLREMLLGLGGRVRAADQAGDVDRVGKAADRDAVARPVLDGLEARLQIDAERLGGRQGLQQRGLARALGPNSAMVVLPCA